MANSVQVFPAGFRVLNSLGQPVTGAQIRFFQVGTTLPLTVYADKALTQALGPIVYTRSDGYPVANQGSSNVVVVYSQAPYKIDILDSNSVNVYPAQDNVQGTAAFFIVASSQTIAVATIALLKSTTPPPSGLASVVVVATYALDGDGGGGVFAWSAANHSSDVTNDPISGMFVPPSTDTTGASGAWVRQ